MPRDTYRVFGQTRDGHSVMQCCLSYGEAHEQAEIYRNSGFVSVHILPDQPSLAHVRMRTAAVRKHEE